jgi:isopenicillin-N epimerase
MSVLVERPSGAAPSAGALRDVFLLDPSWIFLNHGSFGACPRPVFEVYQRLQLELERQPLEFLDRSYAARVDAARARLAGYLGADVDGLVFVPNTSTAVNTVARSLDLAPGDEVLLTDHEYGACHYALEAACQARGATAVVVPMPYPLSDPADVVAALAAAATPRTRAVFFSHLTSETAAILPVAEICRWATENGILSLVDGAHVPGQIPLDLAAIDPDAYMGNCHKWLCAPKGSAFLWVRADLREQVQPLVVSWGCVPGASFAQRHGWRGTHDPAATLAVPSAIAFQDRHNWPAVRARGHDLAARFGAAVAERYDVSAPYPAGSEWHAQMISVAIPWDGDPKDLQARIREAYRIEVPVHTWAGRTLVRPSFAGYNDWSHAQRLLDALAEFV